jgi:uncharacterized protein YjdB
MGRIVSFALIVSLVLATSSLTAHADSLDSFNNEVVTATAFAIGDTVTFGGPQPGPEDYYEIKYQWYKFTVGTVSDLAITATAPPKNGNGKDNHLGINVVAADGTSVVESVDKSGLEVNSNIIPSKTAHYKVLPGTYYLRGSNDYFWTNKNGYGTTTIAATPVADDPGGEPNDSLLLAKPINLNQTYTGNIDYFGKIVNDRYSQDWYDYYKFEVPENNYGIQLSISRTNDGATKHIKAGLKNEIGETSEIINLENSYEQTKLYNIRAAGTYYLYIDGYDVLDILSDYRDMTEYTFTLTGVPPTTVTMKGAASIDKGKTLKLAATVSPATPARTLTWRSSNTKVATVTSDGVVKGVKGGIAKISATIDGVSNATATCTVTVRQPATKIALNKKSITLKKGKKFTLKAKLSPGNVYTSYKKVKWTSSNKKVATVSSAGKVTAKKKGTAYITATTHNGKKVKCKVKVA